jgi:hypothetical protein
MRPRGLDGGSTPKSADKREGVSLNDFYAVLPEHKYMYVPTRELWPAVSVNGKVLSPAKGVSTSAWLDQHRSVEQMMWAPGEPMLVANPLLREGGWIEEKGATCFNLYQPPTIKPGQAAKAGPWLDHGRKLFGVDFDHIVCWLAHRVQHPDDKINHALVLGGLQGIGKDCLLTPVKRAVGPWNFCEVSPKQVTGRFNGFLKSVILRVSEIHDLGDVDRYAIYERLKTFTAAPPETLRVDEKNLREHAVVNVVGIIHTTNYKTGGMFLPADDRRHYVAWSDLTKDDFANGYWKKIFGWYDDGGDRHVTAYLQQLDLSSFDAKAPPPRTQAWQEIVDSNRAPEDAEMADAIDALGNPKALTIAKVIFEASEDFGKWLSDRKNSRQIPHRFEACGYVRVRNQSAKDGHWIICGKRQAVYAKKELTIKDQFAAAYELAGR